MHLPHAVRSPVGAAVRARRVPRPSPSWLHRSYHSLILLVITIINQCSTAAPFSEANNHHSKANMHINLMSRNSQIINARAMIPEAVRI